MKKNRVLPILASITTLLFLAGCSNSINGSYNFYGNSLLEEDNPHDTNFLFDLNIKGKDAILEIQANPMDSNSEVNLSQVFKGKVDTEKNSLNFFMFDENVELAYKKEKKDLYLFDKSVPTEKVIFYSKKSREYDENLKRFKN